jgi:hypothetical protein
VTEEQERNEEVLSMILNFFVASRNVTEDKSKMGGWM